MSHDATKRWTKETRYYEASIVRDLFGDWTVFRRWGRIASRRGGFLITLCGSEDAASQTLKQIERRRRSRGYAPCTQ